MNVEQRVKELLSSFLHAPIKLTRETRLVEDLACDSLDAVEIIMELEEEFDIAIPDGDVNENISHTVGMVIDYVDKKVNHPQPATMFPEST
jgi:acyl carrier protein